MRDFSFWGGLEESIFVASAAPTLRPSAEWKPLSRQLYGTVETVPFRIVPAERCCTRLAKGKCAAAAPLAERKPHCERLYGTVETVPFRFVAAEGCCTHLAKGKCSFGRAYAAAFGRVEARFASGYMARLNPCLSDLWRRRWLARCEQKASSQKGAAWKVGLYRPSAEWKLASRAAVWHG